MIQHPRIIDVERKPIKCPDCGERVVDIIYGTGDMTEIDFLFAYRREGFMGGDNIPRRPPIWACSCGCKRFRKVNPDGTDAPVQVKMLKNIRKKPASLINWTTNEASDKLEQNKLDVLHHYKVRVLTEDNEREEFNITAVDEEDARNQAKYLVSTRRMGLKGELSVFVDVYEVNKN